MNVKILIADRSFQIRERIKHLVKEIYNSPIIFETESNTEAIAIVKTHKPNIIITDIDLNSGSGLVLISTIKRLIPNSIKIVFTNHVKHDLELISRKLGADYFLSKAHDFLQIKRILNQQNNTNSINSRPN